MENASGVLKEEMGQWESLILKVAKEMRLPAGESLAVDREAFSRTVTETLEGLENVEIVRKEIFALPEDRITVVATGPLTSESLSQEIQKITGDHHLFFYDAIAPTVTADSIDFQRKRLRQLPDEQGGVLPVCGSAESRRKGPDPAI
jgi:methylenetetrahydrofolate--tRNA-(uracil-5-)-methyltransferase